MATINNINNTSNPLASTEVTVDPGASGDSYVQFDINGTGEWRIGVDDNDSDKFKISQGSALGTNDTFVMTADGERTLPLQPSFLASINAEDNVTGNATVHYVGSTTAMTEIIDRGSDFDPGDGAGTNATFTAPITGLYFLTYTIGIDIDPTGGEEYLNFIITSNRNYSTASYPTENRLSGFSGLNGDLKCTSSSIADMDEGDTAKYYFFCQFGAKTDDVVDGYVSGGLVA
jgi:hypothetical protein